MKQRFSSLDVKVIASELNSSLTSLRISNIYDLSSRIFLFKCAKPGSKQQLLVDSGFRAHLTSFSRTAASSPSQFVTRLRKYLKSRRITGVSQVGTDRVIELRFSDGLYRLFLEFFAAGNIILTDADLNVLALLRQVNENDPNVDVKLGSKYVLDAKQNFSGVPPVTRERIVTTLEKEGERFKLAQKTGGKKAKRNKSGNDLRKALSIGFPEFPPHLLEHVFCQAEIDASLKIEDVISDPTLLDQVEKALNQAGSIFSDIGNDAQKTHKGFIIAKVKAPSETRQGQEQEQEQEQDHKTEVASGTAETAESQPDEDLLYEDYHPFLPAQVRNKTDMRIIEIDTFNRAVDQFYSSLESQKLSSRLSEKEETARRKLDTAKLEHEKRLQGLQRVQELHIRKAQTIEANTHRVEEACAAVNGLVAQGMDWVDIGKLIENEQKRGNVVAQIISLPLKLHENTVTLLLDEPGAEDEDSDEEKDETDSEDDSDSDNDIRGKSASASKGGTSTDDRLTIDLNLALSPWANAREYYEQKKTAAHKESKTKAASDLALKSMEKKTQQDLKKSLKSETQTLRVTRKQMWFEKFLYFISSDGYLVLGGRDAAQNEFLYRRHLKNGDVFVHADLHGASCVVIKNHPQTPDAPIPPSTLSQAGALSVCSSQAWDSKAVMAAYWVHADQVSKTAPSGEYLVTGGFVIRGQKNFLPPSQLLLGFGVYWLVSEGSRANHNKNRIQRTESMVPGEAEMLAEDAKGLSIHDQPASDASGMQSEVAEHDNTDEHEPVSASSNHSYAGSNADSDSEDGSSDHDEKDEVRVNPLQYSDDDRDARERTDGRNPVWHQKGGGDGVDLKITGAGSDENDDNSDSPDEQQGSSKEEPEVEYGPQVGHMKPLHPTTKQKVPPPPQKRAPRTKAAKRKAAKYALQDDEDRALAMQLLGNTKAEQRKAAEADAKAEKEAKAEADRARRRAQHNKAADAEKNRQARLAKKNAGDHDNAMAVEDDDDDGMEVDAEQAAQERLEHLNIDLLVPAPEPGDELIAAVPVVAPWTALNRNKYKVKLQPGSMKKGKALKEIVGVWGTLSGKGPKIVDEQCQDKERVWPREIDLIKAWKFEEIVGVLPVKGVRIVQGGGLGGQAGASGSGKGKSGGGRSGKGSKRSR